MVSVADVKSHYISGFKKSVEFQIESASDIGEYSSYLNKTSGPRKLVHYIGIACGEIVNLGCLGYFERKSFRNLTCGNNDRGSNDDLENRVEAETGSDGEDLDSKLEKDINDSFDKNYESKNRKSSNDNKNSPEPQEYYQNGSKNNEYDFENGENITTLGQEKGTNLWKIDDGREKEIKRRTIIQEQGLARNLSNLSSLGPDEIKRYINDGYMSTLNIPFIYGINCENPPRKGRDLTDKEKMELINGLLIMRKMNR